MATYLITGGAGFIGSHLCENLYKDGHRIINVDSFTDLYSYQMKIQNVLQSLEIKDSFSFIDKQTDLERLDLIITSRKNYRLEVTDIRDFTALEGVFQSEPIDAVIHLAAMPGVRASVEQPMLFEDVNVKGTLNILELMRTYGVRKWLCASSSSVYGNNRKVPFSESDAVDSPISLYAATKRSCELMGYSYHHLFDIDTIMLRFFTVYGERQRPDLAIHKFTRMIDQGIDIPFFGDGSSMRDYTYIEDIINGIKLALRYVEHNEPVYEILNLGGHQMVSLREMVETLEQAIGKKANLNMLPMQPGDVDKTFADIKKARALIGFEPKTAFRDGIKKFIDGYKGEQHV